MQPIRTSAASLLFLLGFLCLQPAETQQPSGSLRTSPGSLVATINVKGLQGSVEFVPDPASGPKGVLVRATLRGGRYGEQFKWRLLEFPPDMDSTEPCKEDRLGRIFYDMTEQHGLLSPGKEVSVATGLTLTAGRGSILERALLLRGAETGRLACAPIRPSGSRVRTYRARFFQPLAGEVILRQGAFGTTVDARLAYANGTRKDTEHRWALLQAKEQETLNGIYADEAGRCRNLQHTVFLRQDDTDDRMRAGREPSTYTSRSFRSLQEAPPLETAQGGLYAALYAEDGQEIIACGRIYAVEPKQASARFSTGEISFRQESPYDATLITVDLREPLGAHSFGIDQLPTISRGAETDGEACPNVDGGTIYNPLKVEPESVPAPGKGSADQYAAGDLSGKHGGLESRGRTYKQVYDPQLTMFGVHSVLGRALVLYGPDGQPVACANVELANRRMDTAFATFDTPIQGQVIFRQERDNFNADTSVYIELSHPGTISTRNHVWGIHGGVVATAGAYSTSDCRSAGTTFNPYNASRSGPYSCHCSVAWPLRCQMGDVTGLIGPIANIPAYNDPQGSVNGTVVHRVAKYYYTLPSLPLSGPTSVVGRSVVIGGEDYEERPLTCSNIVSQYQP